MPTTFRSDTSFPYLKIAREHDVPYRDVLGLADWADESAGSHKMLPLHPIEDWQRATFLAWLMETNRRSVERFDGSVIFTSPIPK